MPATISLDAKDSVNYGDKIMANADAFHLTLRHIRFRVNLTDGFKFVASMVTEALSGPHDTPWPNHNAQDAPQRFLSVWTLFGSLKPLESCIRSVHNLNLFVEEMLPDYLPLVRDSYFYQRKAFRPGHSWHIKGWDEYRWASAEADDCEESYFNVKQGRGYIRPSQAHASTPTQRRLLTVLAMANGHKAQPVPEWALPAAFACKPTVVVPNLSDTSAMIGGNRRTRISNMFPNCNQ